MEWLLLVAAVVGLVLEAQPLLLWVVEGEADVLLVAQQPTQLHQA
jgi:hypothetical protein